MAEQQVLNNTELTSTIFQWLKDITLEEHHIVLGKPWMPSLPKSWTSQFACLATVNRMFFNNSIGILWEHMNSPFPLFAYVLRADRMKNGAYCIPFSFQNRKDGITAEDWERFKLYASQVKVLLLKDGPLPHIDSGWLAYLLNDIGRPPTLFPRLRRLFLRSFSPLSMFVASNAASTLRLLQVGLPCNGHSRAVENARALSAGLAQRATALTHLHLTHPTSFNILLQVVKITTLTSLRLHLEGQQDVAGLGLHCLSQLTSLKELFVEQHSEPTDVTVASSFPTGSLDPVVFLPKESMQPSLTTLWVKGNGTMQYLVATTLLPDGLQNLQLMITPDVLNTQMLLIPLVATIYARRNPRLDILSIATATAGGDAPSLDPEALAPVRNDPRLTNLDFFIESLSGLRSLRNFAIRRVPFFGIDIVPRIFKAVQTMHDLESLVLFVEPISTLEEDEQAIPNLNYLEELVQKKPKLTWLELVVSLDGENMPELPQRSFPAHPLKNLGIVAKPDMFINHLTSMEKISLARYIHRLFPQTQIVYAAWASRNQAWEQWEFVDELLKLARDSREQALRELEGLRNSASTP